jgi:Dyp-type peroxidase family
MTVKDAIDPAAMQGLIINPYGDLPCAAYCLLEIVDATKARQWLKAIAPEVTRGDVAKPQVGVNLAITYAGVKVLSPSLKAGTFTDAFESGMVSPYRTRILGDTGTSEPTQWSWGSPDETREASAQRVHVLLMLFAVTAQGVSDLQSKWLDTMSGSGGLKLLAEPITTAALPDNQEHFGFRDSISQPIIEGTYQQARFAAEQLTSAVIKAGEFLLGFDNQYDQPSLSPSVSGDSFATKHLAPSKSLPGMRDLGRYGTYMVVRQLEQDVPGFWNGVKKAAAPDSSEDDIDALAAKLVGRKLDGTPLAAPGTVNNFGYAKEDPLGHGCPVGAHIRRANPRDALGDNPKLSLTTVQGHRLVRRGRSYGTVKTKVGRYAQDDVARGLMFICLNADIERQFEFIQSTWLNNPNFNRLQNENDPLIGNPDSAPGGYMTIPGCPVRKRLSGIDTFITVKGGAYFFLPSIAALSYLSELN